MKYAEMHCRISLNPDLMLGSLMTGILFPASGPFLAVNVIFQKIYDLAVAPNGSLPGDLKNDVLR